MITFLRPSFKLEGEDGNAFVIVARAKKAMRKVGLPEDYIDSFVKEATSGDYDNLLQTVFKYFEVDEDEEA